MRGNSEPPFCLPIRSATCRKILSASLSCLLDMRGNTGPSRETLLADFVTWSAAHITGDEKGQAQIFLDRLFVAFGQRGSLDVGGTAEMRIRKASEDGGGT